MAVIFGNIFPDDGYVPNSKYRVKRASSVTSLGGLGRLDKKSAWAKLQKLVSPYGWRVGWLDSVYPYTHYHSTTHEALVVYRGTALIEVGGNRFGEAMSLDEDGYLVIPAGVAHKRLECSDDFQVFGCYPVDARKWDVLRGRKRERKRALANIQKLGQPPEFISS